MDNQEAWFITERWQEYEGEIRVSHIRLLGIFVFYMIELLNFYGLHLGFLELPSVVNTDFHAIVSILALGWSLVSFGVIFCIRKHFFPRKLMYISTTLDFCFLLELLILADGPKSPLLPIFFLLLALAAIRFNLRLMRFSSGVAILAYTLLTLFTKINHPENSVPIYHQIIFIASLLLMGIFSGQSIRSLKKIAVDFKDQTALPFAEGSKP